MNQDNPLSDPFIGTVAVGFTVIGVVGISLIAWAVITTVF